MEKTHLRYLLDKYDKNELSQIEWEELENWYAQLNFGDADLKTWIASLGGEPQFEDHFYQKFKAMTEDEDKRGKQMPIFRYVAAAAAVLMFISIGLYYSIRQKGGKTAEVASIKISPLIQPGRNKAILTLANGIKIDLDGATKGRLSKRGGITITKTDDGKLLYKAVADAKVENAVNIITIPSGGQYQLVLSDGTHVWLNAASSLKYPEKFPGSERRVELTGEGYFEVAHNAKSPFRVVCNRQTVEVLGTHFNIKNYLDEDFIKTTLFEGSVKVKTLVDYPAKILKPGEQSLLSDNNFLVKQADLDEAIAWKNGYFVFNDEDIQSIMKQIARWYDINVVFKGDFKNKRFGGSISRSKNINEVLNMMQLTNGIHFKIDERSITVMN